MPGRLWRTKDRTENRLSRSMKTISCLEPISRENSVGATLHLRERLYGGILANKHVLSGG